MSSFLFTSESVSEGHPDKVSDQVSDGILDALLAQDPKARVACETLCTTDLIVLSGEITANAEVDYEKVARDVIRDIGYTSEDIGFNADTCEVQVRLHSQSTDIAQGVDADGAGDQGLMFGYACDQTPELMPLPIAVSHRIINKITELRHAGAVDWLRPDAKSQVTVEYNDGKVSRIDAVVVSTQHADSVSQDEIKSWVTENVITPSCPDGLLDDKTNYHINPTGRFVIGGPHGDTGLTGRKIIVDTYGGWGRHGGGAFSGKDSTKVDRSAAYMARHIAKNLVASGVCTECEIQLAYAIGVADPVSINVNDWETGKVGQAKIVEIVRELFPLTPQGIIEYLDLRKPVFRKTAAGGHFGRDDADFKWEATNQAARIKELAGI